MQNGGRFEKITIRASSLSNGPRLLWEGYRIVSISKPYVRPIVRGKEVKSVEF